ncbi:MAG TPA: metal ABC transporter permease [Gemmatimonadaceae bacterium]|nr:metal ABC transporter permease [Gemmatimonadaceae bacterium]
MFDSVLLFREALYGALVIGVACSVLSVYVVLRRIVFVGAALAEISSASIALGLWLTGVGIAPAVTSHPLGLSIAITLASAVIFGVGDAKSRVPADANIGVAYAVAAALGILLISKAKTGEAHDIFLQGNILGITRTDTLTLIAVAVPVLLVHSIFYKEFLFVSFDRETARTLGFNVTGWELLLYLTLGLVIAVAMQFAGVMLVFNFLVLPAVTAMLLAHSMGGMFIWSIGAALAAALVGFTISIPFDLPTGPAIIAVSGALVIAAWLARSFQRR